MFNFEDLDIEKDNNCNAFVGIRKDTKTNRMTFYLPKGFQNFEPSYENIKKLFFSMYRTFKRFEIDNSFRIAKMLDRKGKNRDNITSRDFEGYRFLDEEKNNEVLLYSKINIIDNFFKTHRELDIDSIVQRLGYTENIDYSNIELLLDEGVFLENNAIFIDSNKGEKNIIERNLSELVELYCYIYKELLIELDNIVSPIVSEMADNFSYKHLTSLQSLFSQNSYKVTILILKDCLDIIDKRTAYKDHVYYNIYEVVEQFLYSYLSSDNDNGLFWGINNFSYIWEDMCNNFVLSDKSKKILYCDSSLNIENGLYIHSNLRKKKFGGQSVYIDKKFSNNFHIELGGHKRWLRPDLVLVSRKNELKAGNTLDSLIDNNVLFIRKSTPNRFVNFGDKNMNVEISINRHTGKENIFLLANKAFDSLSERFFKLYRDKGVNQRFLKGYLYTSKSNYSFNLRNISKDKFEEVYKAVCKEVYSEEQSTLEKSEGNISIIDWKYVPYDFFNTESKKLRLDIIKQLTYEFCILKNEDSEIEVISQFCIPGFCSSDELVIGLDKAILAEPKIQIVTLNFRLLQKEYISADMNLF